MFKRTMKYQVVLIFLLLINQLVLGQNNWTCGNTETTPNYVEVNKHSPTSNSYNTKYKLQTYYIPNNNSYEAIKTIPINIVIFLEDDAPAIPFQVSGTMASYYDKNGNLTAGFSTTSTAVQHYEDWMNRCYDNPQPPNGIGWVDDMVMINSTPMNPGTLPDTKIRFVIKHYYFYENSTLCNGSSYENDLNKINYHLDKNPEAINQLTWCIAKGIKYKSALGYSTFMTHNGERAIFVHTGIGEDRYSNWSTSEYFLTESHLSHEFGHQLDLWHTYNTETLDPNNTNKFLDDVFPNPPVYFGGDNVMGGRGDFNDFISPKQMGRMHKHLTLSANRHFAYGYSATPHEITSNEEWDFVFKSYNDIIIKNGAILTLTNRLEMVPQAKIIVEPGGKLIIDGGIITSARCGGPETYWQGIEVLGNRNLKQIPISNQGFVEVKNGGTIRNSYQGIHAIKIRPDGNYDWNYTGGIIRCNGAKFINNHKSIWIGGYHSPVHTINLSYIKNTEFELNNSMLNGHNGVCFIGLYAIDRIAIKGNSFINKKTGINTEERAKGIVAYDADFTATASCNTPPQGYPAPPCTDLTRNTFEGLYYGIYVSNNAASSSCVTKIDQASFKNTYRSVHIINSKNATVTSSVFDIPKSAYGLFLNGCDGFKVEENVFSCSNSAYRSVGIVIDNSGSSNNEIYKNTFSNLGIAIQAQGDNGANGNQGLKLLCNGMSSDEFDITIVRNSENGNSNSNIYYGISKNQGIYDEEGDPASADNSFSYCNGSPFQNIKNLGSSFNYYTTTENAPECVTTDYTHQVKVIKLGVQSNGCPSKINTGGSGGGSEVSPRGSGGSRGGAKAADGDYLASLQAELKDAREALNSSNVLYKIWENGGNANLEEEVKTTLPWDAYSEFNNLIAKAPYLSEEVLLATIKNSSFTPLMVKLIMVENGEAKRKAKIMDATHQRLPEMPREYIDEINTETTKKSQLELLAATVSLDGHRVSNISNDIKRIYRNDYENKKAISNLISFVNNENTIESKYELASLYLETNQFENMDNVLNSIEVDFALTDIQKEDNENWHKYFAIAKWVKGENDDHNALSEEQINTLEKLMATKRPLISSAAIALLLSNDMNYDYHEIVIPITKTSARMVQPSLEPTKTIANDYALKVYPNPSRDYLTLDYKTKTEYNKLWFKISDSRGSIIMKQDLKGGNNQELVNVSNIKAGIYTLILYGDGETLAVKKITIIK